MDTLFRKTEFKKYKEALNIAVICTIVFHYIQITAMFRASL